MVARELIAYSNIIFINYLNNNNIRPMKGK